MKSKKSIKSILFMSALGIVSLFFINMSLAANTAKVSVETANLRETTDESSKILEQFSVGQKVEVSANTFPGTYYITGDTYARSEVTGEDEFFQFIIPKAKVQSENTITLEAEGDPSVFNMSLRVMRPADGAMMKLVKYNLVGGTETSEANTADLVHNHKLTPETPEG